MSGFNFVGKLRGLGLDRVPFVVITASRRDGLWESAQQLGAAGYFEKPYDPARLMAAVGDILSRSNHLNSPQKLTCTPS
jgi:CheY-like chemotaxis protein